MLRRGIGIRVHLRRLWFRAWDFTRRQPRNFKLMLARRALHGLAVNLSSQYNSIYAVSLGADPVQLGSLLTAGNAIAALSAMPAGWLIDRYGLRKVFLAGTLLLLLSSFCYAVAWDWRLLYPGIVLLYVGVRVTCTSCTVIGARELVNEERGTARGLCRTLSAVVTLITPVLAASLVAVSGGITVRGMRPLYTVQMAAFGIIMVLLICFLRDPKDSEHPSRPPGFPGFGELLRKDPMLIRFLAMLALMDVPWSMVQPYMPLFAHQFKNAHEAELAGLAVAISVAPLLFAIPIGRMADRYGRKRLLYMIAPVSYLSSFLLIWATGPAMLYLAGLCFGFHSLATALAAAMASEIVPKEHMGRWIGLLGLTRGLVSVPAPLLAGLIWDKLQPQQVFICAVLLDAAVRLPLLASTRETLRAADAESEEEK